MKIALIGRYGEGEIVTGPERVARELFFEIKNKNIPVVFIEYFFSGYKSTSLIKKLFGKLCFENKTIQRLGIFPLIFTFLRNKYDIIHIINSQRFILFLLLIKKIISGKLVTTFHGLTHNEIPKDRHLTERYFIDSWVERFLVKKSDLIIFPSKILRDEFSKHYNISGKMYQIIPNGISKIFFNNDASFPPIEDSIKMIFYNGIASSINRGLTKLLGMLKNVKCKVELSVIGDRTNVDNINSNVEIIFVEPMHQTILIKFLEKKHFIIKSNTFDTFSMIVAECMSFGLIPIVNKNTGINVFIKNEFNGFVYSADSQYELSDLLNNIYSRKYDLFEISANVRKIYEQLNWTKISEQYLAAYNTVL
jgi:glycosyltransferase involved in cell wall biosynthesis